jgi:hypothetical protein
MIMKKFFLALCVMFALVGFVSNANADFATGLVIGNMLGGNMLGGNDVSRGGSEANVLYVMPRVSERIKEPLQMRTVVSADTCVRTDGNTLSEDFVNSIDNSGKYEVLQVLRVQNVDTTRCFRYWFTYIEKNYVIPVEQLSQPKTPQ